jgi:hypothetical protein
MQDGIYYCPLCKGKVLSTVIETLKAGESAGPAPEETLYCPSCEMLVEAIVISAPLTPPQHYLGRSRAGGSNAGGSQRGDMSDEGASQWRRNPNEGERNTWRDKD